MILTTSNQITDKKIVESTIKMAEELLSEAINQLSVEEREKITLMAKMMEDSTGKSFTTALTDHAFRSNNAKRITKETIRLLNAFGVPLYLKSLDQLLLKSFQYFGKLVPGFSAPIMIDKIRKETRDVIIDGEENNLSKHLQLRQSQDFRMNCNRLGEAILGEEEASERLNKYLEDLTNPDIEYISVKISSIATNLNVLAWDVTLERLKLQLRKLYRQAMLYTTKGKSKFVNLDMEEYRDLLLTKELFLSVLSEDEFFDLEAGIVLQAYLPDAHPLQVEITEWACQRIKLGGAPVRIRIVKGANLAMERIESELRGWAQTPYSSKIEVDSNYKKMIKYGLQKEHAQAVNIGVASHNLFDIAYAMVLRDMNGVQEYVGFEMLEGMAPHQCRAVHNKVKDVLMYAPIAGDRDFISAIAYLVRRLEENTKDGHFLKDMFCLTVDSPKWDFHKSVFLSSYNMMSATKVGANRTQNRELDNFEKTELIEPFRNEADTDWTLISNRNWIMKKIANEQQKACYRIPLQIGGKDHFKNLDKEDGFDPSIPKVVPYIFAKADEHLIKEAVDTSEEALGSWRCVSQNERSNYLLEIAKLIREQRGDLIAIMIKDGGKTIQEADTEISEAIDFAEYYSRGYKISAGLDGLSFKSKGTVLVTPPWNFPFAIPAGGIFASLMAGNTVILKSAPETILTARKLAEICWEAGVPKEVLQFIACDDDPVGTSLIRDPRVNSIILTGATSTARLFKSLRPDVNLFAETGGKNSIYVSAIADQDLAIRDIVQSAFAHAGQKCSACSVVILEKELYENKEFLKRLVDAAKSLPVGSAWNPESVITPLIHEPQNELLDALCSLKIGESWLLEPKVDPKNSRLWSPGIKIGVNEGSWSHLTEFFGPVLSIIKAKDLKHGLRIMNMSRYGLTAGIHSLDEKEQEEWVEGIDAGNLYVNRSITGAIVQRQPFGGVKDSSFGPGAKAGGPNYLLQLSNICEPKKVCGNDRPVNQKLIQDLKAWEEVCSIDELHHLAAQDEIMWENEFQDPTDFTGLKGQKNYFLYRPVKMLFRITVFTSIQDAMRALISARISGAEIVISHDHSAPKNWRTNLKSFGEVLIEDYEEFHKRIKNFERIRIFENITPELQEICNRYNIYISKGKSWRNSRLEILRYVKEQSLSIDIHRYGNVPEINISKLVQ